jgi:hypothetical protein
MDSDDFSTIAALVIAAASASTAGYQLAQGTPKVPELPKPPGSDPAEAARAQAQAAALKQRRGRAATILSGGGTSQILGTPSQGSKQLLGL